jgi:hypothetical protein
MDKPSEDKLTEIIQQIGYSKTGKYILCYLEMNEFEKKVDKARLAILNWIEEELPKENGYAKGLVERIGVLLMGKTVDSMREGFKEFRNLKEIEKERNIGYNAYRSELIAKIEKLKNHPQ